MRNNSKNYCDNSYFATEAYLSRHFGKRNYLDAVFGHVPGSLGEVASDYLTRSLSHPFVKSLSSLDSELETSQTCISKKHLGRAGISLALSVRYQDMKDGGDGTDKLYVVTCGNSQALLWRENGELVFESEKNSSIYGGKKSAILEKAHVQIQSGDRLLLATPGILANVSIDQIYDECVAQAQRPAEVISSLRKIVSREQKQNLPSFFRSDRTAIVRFYQ